MGPLDRQVAEALGVPAIDGVVAAVKALEGLHDYGLQTSRVAAFARPEPKEMKGSEPLLAAFRGVPV